MLGGRGEVEVKPVLPEGGYEGAENRFSIGVEVANSMTTGSVGNSNVLKEGTEDMEMFLGLGGDDIKAG